MVYIYWVPKQLALLYGYLRIWGGGRGWGRGVEGIRNMEYGMGMLDIEWVVGHDQITPGFMPDSSSEQGSRAVAGTMASWPIGSLGHIDKVNSDGIR